ncbi:DUF2182 domain-containing protein [Gordonia sp. CPCC 205515]|uniref:copper chaperone n=1 Tax=Gordonia sp. CPCC 205515 TaxID=3140791 RepID=UPI003AF34891
MIGTAAAEVSLAATRGRSWMSDLRAGRHPQWIAYAVAAVGWVVLVGVEIIRLRTTGSPEVMADMHVGHDMTGGMAGMTESGPHTHGVTTHIVSLLAMLAVMTPMVAADARYAALRAPSGYRRRVPGWVLGGWAVGWLPLLIVTAFISLALGKLVETTEFGEAQLLVAATAVAIAWQWTSRKRLSPARCHRTLAPPLPQTQARTACLRYGLGLGNECGISCAPMMMVMMLAGHSVFVVAPLTAVAWYERRRRPHHDPGTVATSLMLAVVGVVAVLLAVVSAS